MKNKFEQLKEKYISSFQLKHKEIKQAWENEKIIDLHALLHKLAGSSGSYGFDSLHQISKKCAELTHIKPFDLAKIKVCIEQLLNELDNKKAEVIK